MDAPLAIGSPAEYLSGGDIARSLALLFLSLSALIPPSESEATARRKARG